MAFTATLEDRGPCTLTYTGGYFWPLDPRPEEIKILDIAHTTARQCRYAGAVEYHYSVAQHMVVCSWMAEEMGYGDAVVFAALMHDASEGYLIDVPRPLKLLLPQYYEIEERVEEAIAQKYGVAYPYPPEVKRIDNRMLHTEARDLGLVFNMTWGGEDEGPFAFRIVPTTAEYAKNLFLRRFCDLTGHAMDAVIQGLV